MAGEVWADGEPADPKKLQNLQNQIDQIKEVADQSYNLSKTTAGDVTTLGIHHIRSGMARFENGITAKADPVSVDVNPGWGEEYTDAFIVASPKLKDPKASNIRWSISGEVTNNGTAKIVVYSDVKLGAFNFHWISAAIKPSTL
jgi:hypothetical protein